MEEMTVLLTGDYWHSDFVNVIGKAKFPITLRPFESVLSDGRSDRSYQLVVIAQSRRGQFDSQKIEQLLARFVNIPVVALSGSWCEGEMRSGSPVAGLIRVYWHQWQGRLENFIAQLRRKEIGTWQLPKIASVADHVIHESKVKQKFRHENIGVSAMTEQGFRMLEEALDSARLNATWIERLDEQDVNGNLFSVLCVEANSLTEFTLERAKEIQSNFPRTPIIFVLNFPRRKEFEIAAKMGITEIISKPFQLSDLHFAIQRATAA